MSSFLDWYDKQVAARAATPPIRANIPSRAVNNSIRGPVGPTSAKPAEDWGTSLERFRVEALDNVGKAISPVINWDVAGYRPVQSLLSALGAPLMGNANVAYQRSTQAAKDKAALPTNPYTGPGKITDPKKLAEYEKANNVDASSYLGPLNPSQAGGKGSTYTVGREWQDRINGFFAGLNNDASSPNYRFGADVVDAAKNNEMTTPGNLYTGGETNAAKKFWGGLGYDLLQDPLMWVPGGAIAAPVRGAQAGAKAGIRATREAAGVGGKLTEAAKTIPRAIAGIAVGDPAINAVKIGRFSAATKPAGMKQWLEARNYQNFETTARKTGIPTEDLFKLVKGEITPEDLSVRLTASAAEIGGKAAKADLSAKNLSRITEEARTWAKDAEKIHYGIMEGPDGARYMAKAYRGIAPAGASDYLHDDAASHLARPENRITPEETSLWGSRNDFIRQTAVVDDAGNLSADIAPDTGILPSSGATHNTVSLTDEQMLGIEPGMTPEAAWQRTNETVQSAQIRQDAPPGSLAAASGPAISSPVANGGTEYYNRLVESAKRVWSGQQKIEADFQATASKEAIVAEMRARQNPTFYPDTTTEITQSVLQRPSSMKTLDRISEANNAALGEEFTASVASRAELLDLTLKTVMPPEAYWGMLMRLGLNGDESVARFLFGSDVLATSLREGENSVVFQGIREIADLPMEIPGLTGPARERVLAWENAPTPEAKTTLERDAANAYLSALESIGVATRPDAMGVVHEGLDLIEAAPNVPAREYNARPLPESGIPENVNIMGTIVADADVELARIIDDGIESVKSSARPARGLTAKEYAARISEPNSSNSLGHSGSDSLMYRERVTPEKAAPKKGDAPVSTKGETNLARPRVPVELNDIYDHIVGFARTPLEFDAWVNALRRLANSKASAAAAARTFATKLGLKEGVIPDILKLSKAYQKSYLPSFEKAKKAVLMKPGKPNEPFIEIPDATTGVDLFGNIIRDIPGGVKSFGETKDEALLRTAVERAKALESESNGFEQVIKRARRREAVGAKADNNIAELSSAARARAGANIRLTDPLKGNPIFARPTDGSWLDAKTLNSVFAKGSVAAFAENFIESSKLMGDGIRNGFRAIVPKLTWKTNNYRVFATDNIVKTDAQLTSLTTALKEQHELFSDSFTKVIKDTLHQAEKSFTPANVKAMLPQIQKKLIGGREFNAYQEFKIGDSEFYGGDMLGDLSESMVITPWRNTIEISDHLDDALRKGGVSDSQIEMARGRLWESIILSLEISPMGQLRVSSPRLEKLLRAIKIETGESRVARKVDLQDSSLKGFLRNVGGDMSSYNKIIGVKESDFPNVAEFLNAQKSVREQEAIAAIRQRGGQEFLTATQHGNNPMDIHGLKQLLANVEITVTAKGKSKAISADKYREYDMEAMKVIAETIARSNGEQDIIAQFSSGETLASYLRTRTPWVDDMMTVERARRIREIEAINDTSIWDGDALFQASLTVDVERTLGKADHDLGMVFNRITSQGHRSLIDNAATTAYQKAIQHVSKSTSGVYRQESSLVAWKTISDAIEESKLFTPGSIESWNAKQLAMRKLRLQQQQSGVFDVTALSQYGGRTKPGAGIDPDFAYIGALDIIDAMSSALGKHASAGIAMPDDAARFIFDTLKIKGIQQNPKSEWARKGEYSEVQGPDGVTFPITVAQELSVLSMKMNATDMPDMARAAWLYDSAIFLLKRHAGSENYAEAAMIQDSGAARAVAMLATSLSNRNVAEALMMRHQSRGALAVATAEVNSVRIAQPILDALTEVADNVFASAGDTAKALDSSIDVLRKQLVDAGFAKGSLEHMISVKKLETHSLKSFSPMDHTTARVQRRMQAASAEPDPIARQVQLNAERATTARLLHPMTEDAVIESLSHDMIKAVEDGATEELLAPVLDRAIHAIDEVVEARLSLPTHIAMGTDVFKIPDSARLAGGVLSDFEQIVKDTTSDWTRARREFGDESPEAAALEVPMQVAEQRWRNFQVIYDGLESGKSPADLRQLAHEIANTDNIMNARGDVTGGVTLQSAATTSKWQQWYSVISGQAGMKDLISPMGAETRMLEQAQSYIETALEDAFKYAQKHGIDESRQRRLISELVRADDAWARAAYLQFATLEESTFAKMLFSKAGSIIDGSAAVRGGMSSDWINNHLSHTILANTKVTFLPPGLHGVTFVTAYKMQLAKLISGELGDSMEWLSVLKGYNSAFHNATIIPNIAADFSAKYGHKSFEGLTAEAAANMGWVRIKREGTIAKFIDTDQLYPKDMVEQLANMQTFTDKLLAGRNVGKFYRGMDALVNPIKASITLWQLRNHLVNVVGEAWTNVLAGVWNPFHYKSASEVMSAGNMWQTMFKHNRKQDLNPLNTNNAAIENLPSQANGNWRVGSKTQKMTPKQRFDFYNQNGIIVANRSIEDLVRNGSETIKRGNLFTKMTEPFWRGTRALAEAASRRDNWFRIAHAEKIMKSRSFRSLDEAADYLRREVSEYHPTMHHLSPFEQKHARRWIFFYTWQRGALKKAIEALIETPGNFMIAPKINYNLSIAMGGDPESTGHLSPNDPRLPNWAMQSFQGPVYKTSQGDIVQTSMNAPQLDVLQKYLGGLEWDSRLSNTENVYRNSLNFLQGNTVESFNPIMKGLLKASTEGTGYTAPTDWGQWATDQTGLGSLSRSTGMTLINNNGFGPWGHEGDNLPFPMRSGIGSQREMDVSRMEAFWSSVTPFRPKMTSEYSDSAQRARTAAAKTALRRAQNDPTLPLWQRW